MPKYSEKQLWDLFNKLPDDLKDAIFSEDTADSILSICQRYKIEDKKISKVAELAGNSLMGLLPPDQLQGSLEKDLALDFKIAKKISQEINRFVLYPVKESLSSFYEIELAPGGKIMKLTPEKKEKKKIEPAKEEPSTKDIYREPIE